MKFKNYIASLFIGIFIIVGYFIFQYRFNQPIDDVVDQDLMDDISIYEQIEDIEPMHSYFELDNKNFITNQERKDLFEQLGLCYLEKELFNDDEIKEINAKTTQAYLDDIQGCDLF